MSHYSKLKHKRNILTLGFREIYVLGMIKGGIICFLNVTFVLEKLAHSLIDVDSPW